MAVLYNAYSYVYAHVSAVNRTETVESLEEVFASFCRVQTDASPIFADIALDAGEASRFNKAFAHALTIGVQEYFSADDNPMTGGYGASMERSMYASESVPVVPVVYRPFSPIPEDHEPSTEGCGVGAPFEAHIVLYAEPASMSCSVPLSRSSGDYGLDHTMQMSDYRLAFNTTPEPLAPEQPVRTVDDIVEERRLQDYTTSAEVALILSASFKKSQQL